MKLEFNNITLLSDKEYKENRYVIPFIPENWWLRTYDNNQNYVPCVNLNGSCYNIPYLDCSFLHVRPVLIGNLKSFSLNRGNRFEFADCIWVVLNDTLAICKDSVGRARFRNDWRAADANSYEKSDIRKWLYNWAEEKGIMFTPV